VWYSICVYSTLTCFNLFWSSSEGYFFFCLSLYTSTQPRDYCLYPKVVYIVVHLTLTSIKILKTLAISGKFQLSMKKMLRHLRVADICAVKLSYYKNIQRVSEKCGHTLGTSSTYQKEESLYPRVSRNI
jgi:hypothetical protein